MAVRFIRKNGRIIPISTDSVGQDAHQSYARSAAYTAAAITSGTVGQAAKMAGHSKLGAVFRTASIVGAGANFVREIVEADRVSSESDGERSLDGELTRQYFSGLAGSIGATAVAPMLFKSLVHGFVRAPRYANQAARAFHSTVKPYTAAYADYRKFKNAKQVKNIFNPAGLLTFKG